MLYYDEVVNALAPQAKAMWSASIGRGESPLAIVIHESRSQDSDALADLVPEVARFAAQDPADVELSRWLISLVCASPLTTETGYPVDSAPESQSGASRPDSDAPDGIPVTVTGDAAYESYLVGDRVVPGGSRWDPDPVASDTANPTP